MLLDRTVGSTVNFTCNDGYIIFGPATRNCTSLGSWTGITPSCISMFTSFCMYIAIATVQLKCNFTFIQVTLKGLQAIQGTCQLLQWTRKLRTLEDLK